MLISDLSIVVVVVAAAVFASLVSYFGWIWALLMLAASVAAFFISKWAIDRLVRNVDVSDDDVDHMLSWSITSRLAALPPNYPDMVPGVVVPLIAMAKELHPEMQEGAVERHAAGDSQRIWTSGF